MSKLKYIIAALLIATPFVMLIAYLTTPLEVYGTSVGIETPVRLASLPFLPLPHKPDSFYISVTIEGRGKLPGEVIAAFIKKYNPSLTPEHLTRLTAAYIKEGAVENINHDIAVAQMILETGYLRYGGSVLREQNNFAGLGALDSSTRGGWFESVEIGVRAHIQHLKAYGSGAELVQECVDERFRYVERGVAVHIFDLAGRWATDQNYGEKIYSILRRLHRFRYIKSFFSHQDQNSPRIGYQLE